MSSRAAVEHFFTCVERRDLDALLECFSPAAVYQNVPYERAVGRSAIRTMFERILERSERVEWEIRTAAYLDDRAHVERVDRFWIDGTCYAVPCHCVAEVDVSSGLITEFRDYLDLGMWRQSLGSVLDR